MAGQRRHDPGEPSATRNSEYHGHHPGTGLDRQVLYRATAKAMISQAVADKGLGMPNQRHVARDDVPAWATQKIPDWNSPAGVSFFEAAPAGVGEAVLYALSG